MSLPAFAPFDAEPPSVATLVRAEYGGLSARDFQRVARFVQNECGIVLPPSKHSLLEGRLRRRLRATGHESFASYCDFLFSAEGRSGEASHLIDAVTTNKTDFFREPEHFQILAHKILPALLETARSPRTLKFWSAASSTGCEAYTMAMVAADLLRAHPGHRLQVLGTDISTEVLHVAATGIYPAAAIEPVPLPLRQAYLTRSRDGTRIRIAPHLRAKVQFARMNLMQERYAANHGFDVVFCRNVLIYFDRPTQARVVRQLCTHLRPGGTLVLGHSESLAGVDLPMHALGHTMFQRPLEQR